MEWHKDEHGGRYVKLTQGTKIIVNNNDFYALSVIDYLGDESNIKSVDAYELMCALDDAFKKGLIELPEGVE